MTPAFSYHDGALCAEDVALAEIAETAGTPFYCYSSTAMAASYHDFADAFTGDDLKICYSVKANSNQAVLATFARLGAGADVVSEGECRRALAAGIPAEKIVFSGVGKTEAELAYALDAGIFQFNVESEPELEALNTIAVEKNRQAPVSLRVNPDVDADTHDKITTGRAENKFGICWRKAASVYARAAQMPGITIQGVDCHIGSQITDLAPFEAAFTRLAELVPSLRGAGHDIRHIDLGGGLGIPYHPGVNSVPTMANYAALAQRILGGLGCGYIIEPGRSLVGNAGVLVTRVIYVKEGDNKSFIIVDAAMNDLIRQTLYDAHHEIWPLRQTTADETARRFDVVGPVCETGDYFAKNRELAPTAAGDLLAIMSAGAYGAVQSSQYNTRPLVPEVLVRGGEFSVVRPRPDYDQIITADKLPPWL